MFLAVYDPATNPLNSNEWIFPILELIHIPSFGIGIGTIALVDVKLFGLGFGDQSAAKLLKDTIIYTVVALTTAITTGLMIFTTDPYRYYYNHSFRVKVLFLTLALIFNFTVHNSVAKSAKESTLATKLVAFISLFLWVGVVFGGLFYAFTD